MDFDKKLINALKTKPTKDMFSVDKILGKSNKRPLSSFDKMFKTPKMAKMKPMSKGPMMFKPMQPMNPLKRFGFTPRNKKTDWDWDGVPNYKDCQPRNPMRQDKLSPRMKKRMKEIEEQVKRGDIKVREIVPVNPIIADKVFRRAGKKQPGETQEEHNEKIKKFREEVWREHNIEEDKKQEEARIEASSYNENPYAPDERPESYKKMDEAVIGWNKKIDALKKAEKDDVFPPYVPRDAFGFEVDPYGRQEEEIEYAEQAARERQAIEEEYAPQQAPLPLTPSQKRKLDRLYDEGDIDELDSQIADITYEAEQKAEDPTSFTLPQKYGQALAEKYDKELEEDIDDIAQMEEDYLIDKELEKEE